MDNLKIIKNLILENAVIHICSNSLAKNKQLEDNFINEFSCVAYKIHDSIGEG